MTNIWIKQAYVQGFDCKYNTFKEAVKIFERIGIAEYIYEGVVEHSYKNILGQIPHMLITVGKREYNPPILILTPR